MKELKDYVHLYIGCRLDIICDMPDGKYFLSGFTTKQIPGESMTRVQVWCEQRRQIYWLDIDVVYLILRPLESMTREEKKELAGLLGGIDHLSEDSIIAHVDELVSRWYNKLTNIPPNNWMKACNYLRSIGIDIFGLKEAGLAMYGTENIK